MQYGSIGRLSSEQYGLISVGQLKGLGFSHRRIDHLVDTGFLTRLRKGVFRILGSAPSWHQSMQAVALAEPRAIVSHVAAAHLWQLGFDHSTRLEITHQPGSQSRLAGVRVHRTRYLFDHHKQMLGQMCVTTPARTMLDLAGCVDVRSLETALHAGLDAALFSLEDLWTVLSETQKCKPRGARHLRSLLNRYEFGGNSALERRFRRALADSDLPDPVAQYDVLSHGRRYVIDFAYPQLLIAIETDGFGPHSTRKAFDADRVRHNHLEADGWVVLHVTSRAIREGVAALKSCHDRRLETASDRGSDRIPATG